MIAITFALSAESSDFVRRLENRAQHGEPDGVEHLVRWTQPVHVLAGIDARHRAQGVGHHDQHEGLHLLRVVRGSRDGVRAAEDDGARQGLTIGGSIGGPPNEPGDGASGRRRKWL